MRPRPSTGTHAWRSDASTRFPSCSRLTRLTRFGRPCRTPTSSRRPTCTPPPTIAAISPRSSPSAPSRRRSRRADGRQGHGQRGGVRARRRTAEAPDPLPPRRPRPDRQSHRLRHRELWRVLRHRRRRPREELHDAGRAGRWRHDRDGGGACAGRRAQRPAAGVLRASRAPVRLLHAGDAHECNGIAPRKPASERGRDPQGSPGQPLPLHGVRQHRRGGQGGGGMTETTVTPERPLVVEEGESKPGFIGQNVPRKEDKRLVQGEGVFFDDMKRHEMGYVHFVRSPYAHARIKSVDVSKALELDGVYGTLTGDEVAILTDPFFELSTPPGAHIKDYALAVGKVRHVGDPVAAVVARTRDLARDAAELVEVEYEPLPLVLDGEEALKDDVVLHEDAASNTVWSGVFDWGDFDAAVAEADHVIRIERLHFDRFSSTPLECSGCVVEFCWRLRLGTRH